MSPASQGTLEVERYIGSCLISANARTGTHKAILNKKFDQNNSRGKNKVSYCGQNYSNTSEQCSMQYGSSPGGWAGAPLISMTSSPRRCNQRSSPSLGQQQHQLQSPQQQQSQQLQQQHAQVTEAQSQQQQQQQQLNGHLHKSPLSRLAIHTQGAPLILAGRFHNRGKVHTGNGVPNNLALGAYVHANGNSSANAMNGSTMNRCPAPSRARRPIESTKKTTTSNSKSDCSTGSKDSTGTNITNIDSLSIASDESSGSNNSENSLPRIIKPRKRRKKDRKPPNGGIVVSSENPITKSDESQQQLQQQQQQHQRTSPNAMADPKPYVSGSCYEQRRYESSLPVQQRNHRRPPVGRESVYGSCRAQVSASSVQAIGDIRQQRYAHRHVQVKVLDDNRNVLVPDAMRAIQSKAGYRPHGHHHHHHHHHHHVVSNNNNNNIASRYVHQDYNDVPCEDGLADGLGLCQCRYCDPSGLIWDVDQNGYSPYLTVPTSNDFCNRYPQQPAMFLSRGTSLASQDRPQQQHQNHQQRQATIERLFDVECSRLTQSDRDTGNAATLRRSWSDPTSYFSDEISTPSKDVGVIGDRGQSENGKRCGGTFWHGDTASAGIGPNGTGNVSSSNNNANNVGAASPSSKGLEVSTEIVTSPNGHRDLEIKFYSPSPLNAPISAIGEDKSILLAEEEEEDFNDIWSYHESKLQQDFRSLLQAEE